MDKLIVKDLEVRNIIGVDSWERSKRQPLIINITAFTDISPSGTHDLLSESVSYSAISKEAQSFSESTAFRSLETLAAGIALACLVKFPLECVSVSVRKPRALLHAASAGVELIRRRSDIPLLQQLISSPGVIAATAGRLSIPSIVATDDQLDTNVHEDILTISDLVLNCIIGVNAWEREERQRIIVNLKMFVELNAQALIADHVPKMHNYRTITRLLSKLVEDSSYKTVEALALCIAHLLIHVCLVPKVNIRIEKPSALTFAASAGVEITRTRESLLANDKDMITDPVPSRLQEVDNTAATVFLSVGANMGDRVGNIHHALLKLVEAGVVIIDTSFLYETSPMYVHEQPNFLNCCIKVKTTLPPLDLLHLLKRIEADQGRDLEGGIRNGPRLIDLDILFYNHLELSTDELTIPHPRIAERKFVLHPLCDIAPDMEHIGKFRTCRQQLALLKHQESDSRVWKVMSVRGKVWRIDERTYIMGVLNITPDSFSDGNKYLNIDSATTRIHEMIAEGTDIIDVGGNSTRPGSEEATEEDELNRVVSTIKSLRIISQDIPVSVDTFRASVALAAVASGADFINDVSGGTKDPLMLDTMAKSQLPVCLMHMRGEPKSMMGMTEYSGGVIENIRSSISTLVENALAAGIYRWNIMIDPGIGFAKTLDQNYEVLRRLPDIVDPKSMLNGFPILIGPSRKAFIGKTIDEIVPEKRGWGTAAACSAAVAGGACIMRVHDIKEMRDVLQVADKCFRI
ncbi:hypothetical protein BASA50_000760 [Batrachochytrium salamandrivorans]|uniref:Pterin-binding domain-containing protein n=1 Tax=Batrachochytrium salamandrivorans TaxID=1357716 RepID=A0ABQ8ETH2_9FUNG|nr:hypothetical protein BASA62_002473 [Batrachochytrium salamandrivorans]KAH6586296.1 hypothetical protein BASA50_000760 [Batrachochytrium salamandrivorans]KAH6601552.1 hypothetical protein BASA61_001931 [Batrachochytrium salamandrivorans]KAH9275850.1 dihydropteroate synthase [Batrachochytrium salamandrivorans]KAJ1336963.1 dihydropteroate synthase [Batrachochytrium salamandrivorans]